MLNQTIKYKVQYELITFVYYLYLLYLFVTRINCTMFFKGFSKW